MSKFFSEPVRHAIAWEFLELKQGSMIVLEYIAKFTELARFGDDYVAIDMARVRKFKDGLKLSIRCKIVGFLLQDMDSMVRTAMAIEREIDDKRNYLQRQGSQSYETPQSQYSVRHTSTQCFPSYPNTGHRNQCQPQGAAQAPTMSRKGQRGHSMG